MALDSETLDGTTRPDLPFRCEENRSVAFVARSRGLTSFGRLRIRGIPTDNNSPIARWSS